VRRCLACSTAFDGEDWSCPACGWTPDDSQGLPQFAPALAHEHEGYDPAGYATLAGLEADSFWFQARNRLIAWALRRYRPGAGRILEIGCGTGYVLQAIAAAAPGAETWGSEVHVAGLAFARQRAADRVRLAQFDARAIPFDAHFDAVGAFDVLEHIREDTQAMAEVHRTLRPGGVFLINVPQHMWLWSAADEQARHVRRYSRGELCGKLETAGFEIVRVTSFVALLLPAMLAVRALRRWRRDGDISGELTPPGPLNGALAAVLRLELLLIKAGLSLPAGGSLFVVARKPGT